MIVESCDSETMIIVEAAKILRKHTCILNMKIDFTGSFSPDSNVQSVPHILLSFQSRILDESGIMKEKPPP